MASKLVLYIFPFSPPARAAWMTIRAVDMPVEIKNIDIYNGEQYKPEFLEINPQHTVPTLVDDNFVLWESRAIQAYVIDKYGSANQSLYPKDLQKRAEVDRLLMYDAGTVWIGVLDNWVTKIQGKPPPSLEREKAFHDSLNYLDGFLKNKKYLTGDDLTIADISIGATLSLWEGLDEDLSKWCNLLAWYFRLKTLPFWIECNQGLLDLKVYYQKKKAELEKKVSKTVS